MSFHDLEGRRTTTSKKTGRVRIYYPEHPNSDAVGYLLYHRVLIENKLKRYLEDWELVHHKDGNPSNNKLSNLELTDSKGHGWRHRTHERPSKKKLAKLVCEKSVRQVSKDLGVSNMTILTWCKELKIDRPPKNSFQKRSRRQCRVCGKSFQPQSSNVRHCSHDCKTIGGRKVVHPDKQELAKLVWQYPKTKIAEMYGVSDVAIGNWCKRLKIQIPPRGYWVRRN